MRAERQREVGLPYAGIWSAGTVKTTTIRGEFFLLVVALTSSAQEAAVLTNNGEPVRVSYPCVEEDLQWPGWPAPKTSRARSTLNSSAEVREAGKFWLRAICTAALLAASASI
jgi:hypothetical protein